MIAFFEFVAELFIQIVWESVLNFTGACIRFPFSKKKFKQLLEDGMSPLTGIAAVVIIIVMIPVLK
ncbi:MAG: hypothetical protein GXC73_03790 [Chitinophagaceae bacterium]|nr:hypothetical protein [Chitinophagaceae bacterium]